jgi:hypothetical protein
MQKNKISTLPSRTSGSDIAVAEAPVPVAEALEATAIIINELNEALAA